MHRDTYTCAPSGSCLDDRRRPKDPARFSHKRLILLVKDNAQNGNLLIYKRKLDAHNDDVHGRTPPERWDTRERLATTWPARVMRASRVGRATGVPGGSDRSECAAARKRTCNAPSPTSDGLARGQSVTGSTESKQSIRSPHRSCKREVGTRDGACGVARGVRSPQRETTQPTLHTLTTCIQRRCTPSPEMTCEFKERAPCDGNHAMGRTAPPVRTSQCAIPDDTLRCALHTTSNQRHRMEMTDG